MASKARGSISASTGDLVRTVAILVGVLAVVALVLTSMGRPDSFERETVDYERVLAQVRADYPYPVLAPSALPEGWRATSVSYESSASGHRWRLGFLVDDQGYVGLEQSDGEIVSYLSERMRDFTDDGTSEVGGVTWDRMIQSTRPADRALVRVDGDVVTIVRGTEPYAVLERFAAGLEP